MRRCIIPLLLLALTSPLPTATSPPPATPPSPLTFPSLGGAPYTVTYDTRSFKVNDEPVLLLSGSVHYQRAGADLWDRVLARAVVRRRGERELRGLREGMGGRGRGTRAGVDRGRQSRTQIEKGRR